MMKSSLRLLRQLAQCQATGGRLALILKRPMSSTATREVVTEGFEVLSPFPDVPPESEPISTLFLQATQRFSNHTALECGLTGQKYTYGELSDKTLKWVGVLHRDGVGVGSVVSILMPNCPQFPIVFGGAMIAGAAVSCINATFTPGEVKRQLEDNKAKVLIVHPLLEPIALAAVKDLQTPPKVFVTGPSSSNKVNLLELLSDKNLPFGEPAQLKGSDTAVLQYSSGTTGVPKGAIVSHAAASANLSMSMHPGVFSYKPTTSSEQEAVMGLMPFFHAWGMYIVMTCSLIHGAKVVTLPQFIPEAFIGIIKKHQVRVLHLVPPLLQFLVGHPLVTPADLSSVRVAICSAAPCPESAARALKAKSPNPICFQELYGMTETMPSHSTPRGEERIGSCGVLLPNIRAKVLDLDTRQPLPPGEPGELVIKTPAVMDGYHNNEAATKEMISPDGWLNTGDVAKYDDDGYFYIVDRIKELIKVKGIQVSPSEVEEELLQHPGIADAGVVGVEDSRAGELPRAYIVRRDDKLTEAQVADFIKERMASHKHLAGGVYFVDELPKNATGKLLRTTLKQMAKDQ